MHKLLCTAAVLFALSAPALAQDGQPSSSSQDASGNWQDSAYGSRDWLDGWHGLNLGIGAAVRPEYLGAEDYKVAPVPIVEVRWGEHVYVSAREGVGLDWRGDNYRVGVGMAYDMGRDGDGDLRGMGDIDWAPEAHLHAAYGFKPVPIWLEGEFRQDVFNTGHEGWHTTVGLKYRQRSGENLSVSMGPTLTYASEDYMESYFGVSARQAARSQYNRYNANAGFRDMGFDANVRYDLTEGLYLTGFGAYKSFLSDAKDSPVSEDNHSLSAGAAVGYGF